ncbi:hypothetical protein ACA910_008273 [Epithemia clementina (nom. ined.)]
MAIQKAGYGVSSAESTDAAVTEAVFKAKEMLGGDATPTMAFVSATVSRDIEEVRRAFVKQLPDKILMHGITSSAALLQPGFGSVAASVGCLLISSNDDNDFATAFDAKGDGAQAAAALKEKMEAPRAILMGTTPGAEEGVLESLSQAFPGVPVFGGTAADDALNGAWKVWSVEASSGTGVSLVGIGPNVPFGASMVGPYTPTGKKCIATKTEGRRVFEIDGKPAADWVYEWLGDEVKDQYEKGGLVLPETAQKPIAVQTQEGEEYITAHCAAFSGAVDSPQGTYVDFFAPIPQGSILTVMDSGDGPETGYASALNEAFETAQAGLESTTAKAGLLIYCGGMAIAVGDNLDSGLTSDEMELKAGKIPFLGMTCFGEQTCLPTSKKNAQRNLSVGMVLFG